jgi:hypothetical protein
MILIVMFLVMVFWRLLLIDAGYLKLTARIS